jgi:archaellum component FlaC
MVKAKKGSNKKRSAPKAPKVQPEVISDDTNTADKLVLDNSVDVSVTIPIVKNKRSKIPKSNKNSKGKKNKKVAVVDETPVVDEGSSVVVDETPVVDEDSSVVVDEGSSVVVDESSVTSPNTDKTIDDDTKELTEIELLGKNLFNLTTVLGNFSKQIKDIQNEMKTIHKQYNKVSKEYAKMTKKRNNKNNKPSGFAIPTKLSDEMLEFLGLEKDVKVPRNEVLKLINKYIVENNLREEKDKRIILPDKKLKKLLNIKKNDKVTYFNLQSFLKTHFVKT